jgi:hypothetical protein
MKETAEGAEKRKPQRAQRKGNRRGRREKKTAEGAEKRKPQRTQRKGNRRGRREKSQKVQRIQIPIFSYAFI